MIDDHYLQVLTKYVTEHPEETVMAELISEVKRLRSAELELVCTYEAMKIMCGLPEESLALVRRMAQALLARGG